MFALFSYLRGEKKLWKAFWLLPIQFLLIMLISSFIFVSFGPVEPTSLPIYIFLIPMDMLAAVIRIAIWQCAGNCKRRIWTRIVKLSILLGQASLLFRVMMSDTPIFQSGSFNLLSIAVFFDLAFFVFLFIYIIQHYKNDTTKDKGKTRVLIFLGLSTFFGFLLDPFTFKTKSIEINQAIADYEFNSRQKEAGDLAFNKAYTYHKQKNYKEAVTWYQTAIGYGDTFAKNNLAGLYEDGQGVPADIKKAMQLYREAAQEGDYMAYYNMGLIFESGKNGEEQSFKKAFEHFLIAAQHGNGCALTDLGRYYAAGTGVAANANSATYWLQKAAIYGLEHEGYFIIPLSQEQQNIYVNAFTQYQLAQARHEAIPASLNKQTGLEVARSLAKFFQQDCRQ